MQLAESTKMIKISSRQICAARELLGITQSELAAATGLGPNTISRIETATHQPQAATIRTIVQELVKRGIEFSNGTGLGVRLDFKKARAFEQSRTTEQRPVEEELE